VPGLREPVRVRLLSGMLLGCVGLWDFLVTRSVGICMGLLCGLGTRSGWLVAVCFFVVVSVGVLIFLLVIFGVFVLFWLFLFFCCWSFVIFSFSGRVSGRFFSGDCECFGFCFFVTVLVSLVRAGVKRGALLSYLGKGGGCEAFYKKMTCRSRGQNDPGSDRNKGYSTVYGNSA